MDVPTHREIACAILIDPQVAFSSSGATMLPTSLPGQNRAVRRPPRRHGPGFCCVASSDRWRKGI